MFAFEPNICVVMLASKMTESRPTRARGLKHDQRFPHVLVEE